MNRNSDRETTVLGCGALSRGEVPLCQKDPLDDERFAGLSMCRCETCHEHNQAVKKEMINRLHRFEITMRLASLGCGDESRRIQNHRLKVQMSETR